MWVCKALGLIFISWWFWSSSACGQKKRFCCCCGISGSQTGYIGCVVFPFSFSSSLHHKRTVKWWSCCGGKKSGRWMDLYTRGQGEETMIHCYRGTCRRLHRRRLSCWLLRSARSSSLRTDIFISYSTRLSFHSPVHDVSTDLVHSWFSLCGWCWCLVVRGSCFVITRLFGSTYEVCYIIAVRLHDSQLRGTQHTKRYSGRYKGKLEGPNEVLTHCEMSVGNHDKAEP